MHGCDSTYCYTLYCRRRASILLPCPPLPFELVNSHTNEVSPTLRRMMHLRYTARLKTKGPSPGCHWRHCLCIIGRTHLHHTLHLGTIAQLLPQGHQLDSSACRSPSSQHKRKPSSSFPHEPRPRPLFQNYFITRALSKIPPPKLLNVQNFSNHLTISSPAFSFY